MEKPASNNIKPKSKIPVFNGKTNNKTTKVTFKDIHTESNGHETQRPCPSKMKNLCSLNDTSDISFEPDVKALKSILSNKGIETGISYNSRAVSERIVSLVTPVPPNRMSMWENQWKLKQSSYTPLKQALDNTSSFGCNQIIATTPKPASTTTMMESYMEHQENIKIFREKMQQHRDAHFFVADPEAKNSILNGQGVSAVPEFLARPSVYKQYSSSLSMMESYLEHEENVRKLRQTTQGILNGLTTPFKSGQEGNLTKSPFARTASVKRNPNLSSSIRKVPLSTPKINSFCPEEIPKMQDVDHLPISQEAINANGCHSKGSDFSDVISGYKPTSILKNPLSRRVEMADSLHKKHSSINRLNNEQAYTDKENVPRRAHFVLNLSDKMRSADMSTKDITTASESSSFLDKSLSSCNYLSLTNGLSNQQLAKCSQKTDNINACTQNESSSQSISENLKNTDVNNIESTALYAALPAVKFSHSDLLSCHANLYSAPSQQTESPMRTPFKSIFLNSKNSEKKLPVRIPVTPREIEKVKPPCRTPFTPKANIKLPGRTPVTPRDNANIKLPARTPVTPRDNESQSLPRRTPVMKRSNLGFSD
ncbi:hypothetical protein Btru_009065 [Bulinus truncatus]|nr:hypothetical protein Btru_009065 [Bulinus truncatus]